MQLTHPSLVANNKCSAECHQSRDSMEGTSRGTFMNERQRMTQSASRPGSHWGTFRSAFQVGTSSPRPAAGVGVACPSPEFRFSRVGCSGGGQPPITGCQYRGGGVGIPVMYDMQSFWRQIRSMSLQYPAQEVPIPLCPMNI